MHLYTVLKEMVYNHHIALDHIWHRPLVMKIHLNFFIILKLYCIAARVHAVILICKSMVHHANKSERPKFLLLVYSYILQDAWLLNCMML